MGADSLAYISIDAMVESTTIPKNDLCRACFDGEYPMDLPDPELLGKHLLESETRVPSRSDADGLASPTAGVGGADALRRP